MKKAKPIKGSSERQRDLRRVERAIARVQRMTAKPGCEQEFARVIAELEGMKRRLLGPDAPATTGA